MEITAPGNKSRSRNPSRGKREKREQERGEEKERKVSQWRRIEKRGYIIYTGLKGLHKNGRTAKKNDGDSGTSWFDAPYRRENNVCSI